MEQALFELQAFLVAVRAMRNAQRTYFKTRDKEALLRSKELEKIVDKTCSYLESFLSGEENKTEG